MSILLKTLLHESVNYIPPHVDVTKATRSGSNPKTKAAARQLFYDFYAMDFLHRQFGPSHMTTGAKVKAAMGDPNFYTGFSGGANWDEVDYPLSQVILNKKFVDVIEHVHEQVTREISRKLLAYLRLGLVQELRHMMSQCEGWRAFRQELATMYNSKKTISKEDFKAAIDEHIPKMANDIPSIMRLLKFSKIYSKMSLIGGKDPFDDLRTKIAVPGKPLHTSDDEPEIAPDVSDEPDNIDAKSEPTPEEPDDTDYNADIADYPDYEYPKGEFDPEDPFDKKKKRLKEDYAAGRISPSTIKKIYNAFNESGLTWQDVDNAYNKIPWGGSFGGPRWGTGSHAFLKLVPQHKDMNTEEMAALVDHIFDLEHNTGGLLNKGGMNMDDEDLDRRAKATHVARYLPYVSPVVKRLILMFMRYLPGDPEAQKNIDAILDSPTKPFTPEEDKVLKDNKFYDVGDARRANIRFFSKKKDNYGNPKQVNGRYYEVKSHTSGKYTVADGLKADVQVFDNFEDVAKYINTFKNDIKAGDSSGGLFHAPSAPTPKSEKDIYIASHSKIKLPKDKEELLYTMKMGWRPSSKCYKAYFDGSNRFRLYAFSDGSFLCAHDNNPNGFKVFTDWNAAVEYSKIQSQNATDKNLEDAKQYIGLSSNTVVEPAVAPAGNKTYAVNSLEQQSIAQLVAASFPETSDNKMLVNINSDGLLMVQNNLNGEVSYLFSVGKKTSGFGHPYKVFHYLAAGGTPESWPFSSWKNAFAFIKTNISKLMVKSPLGSQFGGQTPSHVPFASKELPPNSESNASYKAHIGITVPPKTSIRLTKQDEDAIGALGFEPKMISSDVWYIHKICKDAVRFYANDLAKLVFTNNSSGIPATFKFDIAKMLAWLAANYTPTTTTSPLQTGGSPIINKTTATGASMIKVGGVQAGSIFEKRIANAGFIWDAAKNYYLDGNNVLVIHKDRQSDLNVNGENIHFQNLPDLANFLSDDYADKKKSKPVSFGNGSGISPTQYEQVIKPQISVYGPDVWSEYIKSTPAQPAHVEIFRKLPAFGDMGSVIFSLGQLGNYYQINDKNGKPLITFDSLNEMVASIGNLLKKETTKKMFGSPSPTGITDAENVEIDKVVLNAGPQFYTEYLHATEHPSAFGKTSYVEIVKKSSSQTNSSIIYSIGVVPMYSSNKGEYFFQINDYQNKPIKQYQTLAGLLYDLKYLLEHGGEDGNGNNLPPEAKTPPTMPSPSPDANDLSEGEIDKLDSLLDQGKTPSVVWKTKAFNKNNPHGAGVVYYQLVDNSTKKTYLSVMKLQGTYEADKLIDKTWQVVITSDKFIDLYTAVSNFIENTFSAPSLTEDEQDWIINYVGVHKPQIDIAVYHDKSVIASDPVALSNGGKSALFMAKKTKSGGYQVTWTTVDGSPSQVTKSFKNFSLMQDFIKNDFAIITQKLDPHHTPSDVDMMGDLPSVMEHAKFTLKSSVPPNQKPGQVYDNDKGDRITLYTDGTSLVYVNNSADAWKQFETPNALVIWMKEHYGNAPLDEQEEIAALLKKYNYQDSPSGDGTFVSWNNVHDNTINVFSDGDVTIYPELVTTQSPPKDIHLLDIADLKQYLQFKHGATNVPALDKLHGVLSDAKFKLVNTTDPKYSEVYEQDGGDTVYILKDGSVNIVGFPKGDSFNGFTTTYSTLTDAAYFLIERFNLNTPPHVKSSVVGSTGKPSLDSILKEKGFVFSGHPAGDLLAMNFTNSEDGSKITIFDDGSGNYQWTPAATPKTVSTSFHDLETMEDFLKKLQPNQSPFPDDESYSISYYDTVGPAQQVYSIRLTKEDEARMIAMGWKYVPSSQSQSVNAYVNGEYKLVFFNRGVKANANKPIATQYTLDGTAISNFEASDFDINKVIKFFENLKNSYIGKQLEEMGFKITYTNSGGTQYFKAKESGKKITIVMLNNGFMRYKATQDVAGAEPLLLNSWETPADAGLSLLKGSSELTEEVFTYKSIMGHVLE